MKMRIFICVLFLVLIVGCLDASRNCNEYPIEDCRYAKCVYDNSEGYSTVTRAQFLNNYYTCLNRGEQ